MFEKVKQAIHVGHHVTDLMRLPCVYSCHKEADGTLCYLLYDWDEQGQNVSCSITNSRCAVWASV